jgi:hypothetical protein
MRTYQTNKYDFPDLALRLACQAESVCRHLLPNGRKMGNEWVVGDISGAKGHKNGGSLRAHLTGPKAGVWMDFNDQTQAGDLVELWARSRCISKGQAAEEIIDWLGIRNFSLPVAAAAPAAKVVSIAQEMKPISLEYHQSLLRRLANSEGAMAYLTGKKRGLEAETIKHFGLGLSYPYPKDSPTPTSNAVVGPTISPVTGRFLNRCVYVNVPEVTTNPIDTNTWMKGSVITYWAQKRERQTILFVCEGQKDTWKHWQELKKAGLTDQMMLISSSHGSTFPDEWKNEQFWASWEKVYLGQDNDDAGDAMAERLLAHIGREAFRIKVPKDKGKDWTDFWQNEGTIEQLRELLDQAPVASTTVLPAPQPDSLQQCNLLQGQYSYQPQDINGAYVHGHLFYPTRILEVSRNEKTGEMVQRLNTVVVRSDRSLHHAYYAPAPEGTPLDQRVLKLGDGTIIEKLPRASESNTWDFESIDSYIKGRAKNRPLSAILEDVFWALKKSTWLPREEDYAVLALTVPVTYVQSVFESVGMLLMNGPAKSGKSQTGNTMSRLCCNGKVIGQVSAATAARVIDETRGFVVLDDIEAIATKAGKDMQISEFVQALKVSYNKHTAIKYWTDVKTMRTEKLNFFGVKMLNNTLGVDSILGSRMIRIQTRPIPKLIPAGMKIEVSDFSVEDLRKLRRLRNELHTWAFENVQKVDQVYREIYVRKTDRMAEIAAPLRTIAQLVGDASITASLEKSLKREQTEVNVILDDPVEALTEAVMMLVRKGFGRVTLNHIQLELSTLLDPNFGIRYTNEIPEWRTLEWLGRQLRCNDLVEPVQLSRQRFFGQQVRMVELAKRLYLDGNGQPLQDEKGQPLYVINKKPEDFCPGCAKCDYRNVGCSLQEARMAGKAMHGTKSSSQMLD